MNRLFYCINILFFFGCNGNDTPLSLTDIFKQDNQSSAKVFLEKDDYINWYKEVGAKELSYTKKIDGLAFSILYKPYEYEFLCANDIGDSLIKEDLEKTSDLQYFTIRIAKEDYKDDLLKFDLANYEEYDSRVKYYSFDVGNDIKLIDGLDTLNCVGVQYERTYSLNPYITLVVNFLNKENKGKNTSELLAKTIVFEDRVFGKGTVILSIDEDKIRSIPSLKL